MKQENKSEMKTASLIIVVNRVFLLLSCRQANGWSSRLRHTGHGVHRVLRGRVPPHVLPTLSRAGHRHGGLLSIWRWPVWVAVTVWWLVRWDASWSRQVGLSGRVPRSRWSLWSRVAHVRGERWLRSHWSAEAWCGYRPNGLIQWA